MAGVIPLAEESSQERAEDHSDRCKYYAEDQTRHCPPFSVLASTGYLREVHRDNVVDHRYQHGDDTPDDKGLHGHFFRSPDIEQQQSDPADRRSWKTWQDASGDPHDTCQYS